MKVDKNTLKKIAHLARLEINEENEESMLESLSDILTWVEKLNEINTDGVEPLTNMSLESNMLREDEVKGHLDHEKALKNAPASDSNYIKVPKIKD
ncbi:MAG: Asp-tRNA(Asn)/Glu-tRNA(Gln) amidotransferase subunit GatC [Cyclobacteriaceae bacterium]|nr:Asp-tRNA(Asn)/Glu-tRNA(Gln) amidotransferase subunit GatC [Cyclobacteriaceae bacterium]